jgi:hypothetical protein
MRALPRALLSSSNASSRLNNARQRHGRRYANRARDPVRPSHGFCWDTIGQRPGLLPHCGFEIWGQNIPPYSCPGLLIDEDSPFKLPGNGAAILNFHCSIFQYRRQCGAVANKNAVADDMRVYAADNIQRPAKNNALHDCRFFDGDVLSEDQPVDLAVNKSVAGDELANDAGTFVNDRKAELSAIGFFCGNNLSQSNSATSFSPCGTVTSA